MSTIFLLFQFYTILTNGDYSSTNTLNYLILQLLGVYVALLAYTNVQLA